MVEHFSVWIVSFWLQNMCGPGVTPQSACFMVNDLDHDGDVDLADYSVLQNMHYECGLATGEGEETNCGFMRKLELK